MRHRRVTAAADNRRAQHVGRGQHRADAARDLAMIDRRPDVERERRVGQRVAQQALFDHVARAVVAFLARLEHEQDPPGDGVALAAQ